MDKRCNDKSDIDYHLASKCTSPDAQNNTSKLLSILLVVLKGYRDFPNGVVEK